MPALADMVNGRNLGRVASTDVIEWVCECPIGASGATGTLVGAPNGMLIAKTGTGIYGVTVMPVTPAAKGRFHFGIYSPSLTFDNAVVTAYDGAAGTATIKTTLAGVATEPASGDKLWIFFEAEPR